MRAVELESQVYMWVQGATGTEVWLVVKLAKDKGSVRGWVFSGERQRRVGGDSRW